MAEELIEVKGRFVRKLTKSFDNNWGVIILKTKDKDNLPLKIRMKGAVGDGFEFSAVGYSLPNSDDALCRYFGTWKESKYGTQLVVDHYEEILPNDLNGRIEYLCSSRFKGIGKKLATNICLKFGADVFSVIEKEPERLLEVKGITKKKLEVIKSAFSNTAGFRFTSQLLAPFGFGAKLIAEVVTNLGEDSAEKIRNNPFVLVAHGLCGFRQADRIARKFGIQLNSGDRITYAILSVLKEDSAVKGNMYTDLNNMYQKAMLLLNTGFDSLVVNQDDFIKVLNNMIKERMIVSRGNKIFLYSNEIIEHEIASMLINILDNPIPESDKKAFEQGVDDYIKNLEFKPSENQLKAVKKALDNRLMIITGGPGTGKTTILKVIIGAYMLACAETGKECTMVGLAPTGKARGRMEQSTGIPCSTIHSACQIRGTDDISGPEIETNLLPSNALIIVDEMSMVDSYVMFRMLQNIDSSCHLILVGDADQLPSVGPGSVLNEMINSGVIPEHRLTEIFRQKNGGSEIIDNAIKVNTGDTNLELGNNFCFVPANSEEEALDQILNIYESECNAFGIDDVAILCPLRHKRIVSVDNLNSILQDKINPKFTGDVAVSVNSREFRVNDRVIQMKNTDTAANGDIGVIQKIVTENEEGEDVLRFYIRFENGIEVKYGKDDMINVELAYAMTIHKSQGSEYNTVIIPLLSSQRCPLFKRNLLYTGITRAKKRTIIIGDKQAVDLCILTQDKDDRNTTLGARLKNAV